MVYIFEGDSKIILFCVFCFGALLDRQCQEMQKARVEITCGLILKTKFKIFWPLSKTVAKQDQKTLQLGKKYAGAGLPSGFQYTIRCNSVWIFCLLPSSRNVKYCPLNYATSFFA